MTHVTRKGFSTAVTRAQNVDAEWDKATNRLRVADAETDRTLAVYSNGEVYGVQPEAPAGQIVIPVNSEMPRIVESLVNAGVIRVTRKVYDDAFEKNVITAEVLL